MRPDKDVFQRSRSMYRNWWMESVFVVSLRAVEAGEGRRGLDGDDLGEGGAGGVFEDISGEGGRLSGGWALKAFYFKRAGYN